MSDTPTTTDPILSATPEVLVRAAADGSLAVHWYDLTCPFCYLGQARTRFLQERGLKVAELPFQAHPDIPAAGIHIGPRSGPMYAKIESDAAAIGLPLNWPPRLPNSRIALAAAEWVRRNKIQSFERVQARLFRAHFADGLDIGNLEVVLRCVVDILDDTEPLRNSLAGGEALEWVNEGEHLGHQMGVAATPSWLIAGKMISGFVPENEFERLIRLTEGMR
ncbi:DsbA family oxidoreductase [Rhizobium mayense]|uniref:DsbA family protein n=1 Tax=Rhizobium mayense TaxID=1312184 RepID=A0ABT7K5I7_9HYPH|nr:DsbA family protein [Rhizobium mayense]MDL2403885.1 DsbA family protein [Rhizobium mayense]